VNIFLLNVAVFTPFNERGATILEFPDHNIAFNKPVTTNVTSNSAFRITGMSPIGAHITGTDDVSDVRVLIDLGSEFLIEEIMITGILPDPEGGFPTGYNKILAVELLDTKLDVTWLSADYINGTYGFIEDWSSVWTFAFSVRTPGVKNITLSELNTTLLHVIPGIDKRITTLDDIVTKNTRKILVVTGTGGQIQTLFAMAGDNFDTSASNTERIQTLEREGGPAGDTEMRFTQHTEALGDLSLGLGLLGIHNQNALSDLSLGLGLMGTHNRTALGDLGLGLGLVGVTIETLQTNTASNTDRIQTLESDGGPAGADGTDGADGVNGEDGVNGTDGRDGADGVNGEDGVNGTDGRDGADGVNGEDGVNGATGLRGPLGAPGATGATGARGPAGADAETDPALEAAIVSLENKLVITYDGGEFLDPNSYVVTRSSPWSENHADYGVYKLFDGDESTFTAFIKDMSGVNGVAFAEFEMGEVVRMSGFRMKPRNSYKNRFPRDTRLFSGTSSSGPWTQIGTSILATSPSNDNNIIVEFQSASSRYFRVVFTNAGQDQYCDLNTFDLLATQRLDVLKNIAHYTVRE